MNVAKFDNYTDALVKDDAGNLLLVELRPLYANFKQVFEVEYEVVGFVSAYGGSVKQIVKVEEPESEYRVSTQAVTL